MTFGGLGQALRALTAALVLAGRLLPAALAPCGAVAQTMPFVEPGGVIRMEMRHSHMLGALGEPPRTRQQAPAGEPALRGGIVFEYPEQGLGFVVEQADREARDPRIARLQVRPPNTWRTHEGLVIGMTREQARPIIESTWHVRYASDQGLIHTIGIADKGGGPREGRLRFVGDKGLVLMEFDASTRPEPPKRMSRKARELVNLLVLLVIALGLTWLFRRLGIRLPKRWEQRDQPTSTPVRDGLGLLLALGGGALAAVALAGIGSGDGYAKMAMLILMLCGFGALMLAMMLWATSARRGLRWVGLGVFVLVIGASVVGKLLR